MSKINVNWFKNGFINQVATLFGGAAIGQALILVFTPFLARIYSTEAFGVFTLYSSVMMLTTILCTFRYEYAIALPENEEDAFTLLTLNFVLSFLVSLLIALFVLFFKTKINLFFNLPKASNAFLFLPIATFINACIQALNYFLIRHKEFKYLSFSGLIKNSSTLAIQWICLGLKSGIGLIIGLLSGLLFTFLYFSAKVLKLKSRPILKLDFVKILKIAKEYKKIPIFTFTADLTGNVSAQLPTLMIGSIFGIEYAAFYGMANRLAMSVFQLIGQSIGQVFFGQAASNLRKNKEHYTLLKRTVLNLLLIGAIPLSLIAIFAHPIFDFILSSKWDHAAVFAQTMVPWWISSFVAMPVVDLFSIIGEQKFHFYFMLTQLIVRATIFYIGAYIYHELIFTLIVFSVISAILTFWMIVVLMRKVKKFDNQKLISETLVSTI